MVAPGTPVTLRELCNAYPGKVKALVQATGVGQRSFYRLLRGQAVRGTVVIFDRMAQLFREQGGVVEDLGGTVDKLYDLWAQTREDGR